MSSEPNEALACFSARVEGLNKSIQELCQEVQQAPEKAGQQRDASFEAFENLFQSRGFQHLRDVLALPKQPRARTHAFLVLFKPFGRWSSTSWVESNVLQEAQDTVSNLQKLESELTALAKEADGQKAKAGHRTSEAALLQDNGSALQDEIQQKMSANLKTLAQQYEKNIQAARGDAEKSKFDSDREEKRSDRHGRKSRKYERALKVSLFIPVGKIIAPIFEHKASTHGNKQAQAQISSLSLRHQYEERTSDAETLESNAEQDLERLRGQTVQAYGECQKCKEEAERLERDAKMAVDAYSALRNHTGQLSKSLTPISMLDFRSREDWKSFQAMANECIVGVTQKVWEEKNLLQSGVGMLVIEDLE